MKAIMYHYVRKSDENLPYFIYLDVENFERQINYFMKKYHILSKNEMIWCIENKKIIKNGLILTFDDGLKDHYNYVFPILKKYNLWGIFYIPTKPYLEIKLLDVHRVHYLIGKFGGERIFKELQKILKNEDYFIEDYKEKYHKNTYVTQKNNFYVTKVKQILNYYIKPTYKTIILDKLMSSLCSNEINLFKHFYLNKREILEMINNGMTIGNHSHSHTLLSNLSKSEQQLEITSSFKILTKLTNNLQENIFCFPYGGKISYDENTLQLLKDGKIKFCFSVENRDINETDLVKKYELPRFDCNEFEYGKASIG